jgi:hypothetical protein
MDEAAMNKFGRFLKLSLKWLAISVAIYIGPTFSMAFTLRPEQGGPLSTINGVCLR